MNEIFKKILNLFKKENKVISRRERMINLLGVDPVEMGLVSEDSFNFNQTKLSEFIVNEKILK
jgi:hypothetical protein